MAQALLAAISERQGGLVSPSHSDFLRTTVLTVDVATGTPLPLDAALLNAVIVSYTGDRNDAQLPHGSGRAELLGGHVYEGSLINGELHGKGRFVWSNGVQYVGSFVFNKASERCWVPGRACRCERDGVRASNELHCIGVVAHRSRVAASTPGRTAARTPARCSMDCATALERSRLLRLERRCTWASGVKASDMAR
jgi:hypothetical protein